MNDTIDALKLLFPAHLHQRIFLVGGAVRDLLLGRPITDIDLAAALIPQEFAGLGFHPVHGRSTAAIWQRHVAGIGTIEATPLRDADELACDLQRRDFTVNAIAVTLSGDVIDPLGGRQGLEARRLSPCSRSTFADDPARAFRAFRFVSDGWSIDQGCVELLRETGGDAGLASIPVERFSREMLKAFETARPELFFRLMLEYDTGRIYLPEIFRMPSVPAGPPAHHPEGDLFTHSLEVLERATALSGAPLVRFCALFHDIGKLATDPSLYPRHHGHDRAGFVMAGEFCRRLRIPAGYGKALAWISRLHGSLNRWDQLRDSTRMRIAVQALKAGIADTLPLVSASDKAGGVEPPGWREALQIAAMSSSELGIELQDLERLPVSGRAGRILQKRVDRFRAIPKASF